MSTPPGQISPAGRWIREGPGGESHRIITEIQSFELHGSNQMTTDLMVDVAAKITLAASASRTEVLAFQLQMGYLATIRFLGTALTNAGDYPSVTWSVLLNFNEVTGQGRFIGAKSGGITSPWPIRIDMRGGDRITVVATNSTTQSIVGVSARLAGWMWPRTVLSAEEYKGATG
jgi:hypothetical protein